MGLLQKLFGKKKTIHQRGVYRKCDADGCGKPIQITPGPRLQIMSLDISHFSIEGMSGYCPKCRRYLCSDHLEFINTTGEELGAWETACKDCKVSVTSGP